MSSRFAVLMCAVLCCLPVALHAQESDVITGRVTDPQGQALSGARVNATSAETGVTRSVLTDNNGRYMLVFRGAGGRFELRVSFIGYAEQVIPVIRMGDEEVLVANVRMQTQAIQLDAVQVRGQRVPPRADAGTTSQELSQALLNRLPLPDFDPTTLALMAAGVIATGDSLSQLGFSVGGMRDALNDVALDGMSLVSVIGAMGGASPLSVPQEAIRRTQVVSSTYDVSRGQFAGGQVSMTTARGTSRNAGSVTFFVRDPALQSSASGSALGNGYTQHQLSGGFGGPLIPNRLFYHGSFTVQRRQDHLFALTTDDALARQRIGVHTDSVHRFLDIMQTRYGFDIAGQTGAYDRRGDALTLMGRVDWNINDAHSLMFSGGGNTYSQGNARIYALELRQNGGEVGTSGYRGMASLFSRIGMWTNDLRVSARDGRSEQVPFDEMPEGQVRIASEGEDGVRSVSAITFGGDRSFPITSSERAFDVSNEAARLIGDSHRVRIGAFVGWSRFTIDRATNRLGTFTFNSLADFEAQQPSSFTRTLDARETTGGGVNAAVYAGDTWRPTPQLQLTYGARLELSDAAFRPQYNPAVDAAFGRRTDFVPTDMRLSPRVGFSYRLSPPGRPLKQLRGGFGEFRARPPFELFASAQSQTGLGTGQVQLTCVGEATPLPDWSAYRADVAAVPALCRDGAGGRPLGARRPNVTLFDESFGAARSWRATLGYQMRVLGLMPFTVEYGVTRGTGLAGVQDLNLEAERWFPLPAEGGRPFFGVPEAISRSTGAVSSIASRRDPAFAGVYDVRSDLASSNQQLTFSFMGAAPPRILLSANYTLSRTRDQSSASLMNPQSAFASATTAANPNVVEWGTSSMDRRHNITTTVAYPLLRWLDVALIGRFTSGAPFTPMVGGDINGDGVRNDRAFVFDPAAAEDSTIAAGMRRLLAGSPRAQQCLESQLGRIADRNSCRNGWTQTLETRLSMSPTLPYFGLDRRVSISVNTMNMLSGVDQLLHGRSDMRGWGQPNRADATLLYPRGFDPANNSFRYVVNEEFGRTRSGRFGFGAPFQVSIQASVALGPQPQQFNVTAILSSLGIGLRDLRSGSPAQIVDRLFANPIDAVLDMAETLNLTEDQVTRVRAISDTLTAHTAPLRDEVRARVEVVQVQDLPRVFTEVQPVIERSRALTTAALVEVRAVLTEEQWRALPARVRQPFG